MLERATAKVLQLGEAVQNLLAAGGRGLDVHNTPNWASAAMYFVVAGEN
jgi:hypothetical protein